MIFKNLQLNLEVEDQHFNSLYPQHIKELSDKHWSSVEVAKLAADFLVDKSNCKVLDIGSGVGKFCLIGAASTQGYFYGVEQRAEFVEISQRIAKRNGLKNVEFIHTNISEIAFSEYDAFYIYNPFYENVDDSLFIDDKVLIDEKLFFTYSDYVENQLKKTPVGTRLVTYWSMGMEILEGFELKFTAYDEKLNFWVKKF